MADFRNGEGSELDASVAALEVVAADNGVEVNWRTVPMSARHLIASLALQVAQRDRRLEGVAAESAGLVEEVLSLRHRLAEVERRAAGLEELAGLAYMDEKTGLPNYAAFKRDMVPVLGSLRARLLGGRRSGDAGSSRDILFFFDLDNFKPVNEGAGYYIGDILLTQVARKLKESQRSGDTTYRWASGDEFVRLAKGVSPESDESIAVTVVEAVASARQDILDMIDDDEALDVLLTQANDSLRSLPRTEARAIVRGIISDVDVTLGLMPVEELVSPEELLRRAFSFMQKLKRAKKAAAAEPNGQ